MANSKLISYAKLSPNCTKPRKAKIDTLTPHCVAGNLTVEATLGLFIPVARQASCNYAIGSDGRIGLGVDEANRSWCSSSSANDHRAITVEIANDSAGPQWHMSYAAIESFVKLAVDVCTRYGYKGLYFDPNKNAPHRNNGYMRVTYHHWYANKACPGQYLQDRMPDIISEVNRRLRNTQTTQPTQPTPTQPTQPTTIKPYTVRVTADTLNIRSGPGTNNKVVGAIKDNGIYTIVDEKTGTGAKKWGKLKSGVGWVSIDFVTKV